ncbi:DUF3885 domain-containing protein [Sutcliffiella halmapala]|uniref:DUF3885 domain-containing protein n=1 Tax=Sutcliffiella halmapala TaxID=79882 RepID=UPI0009957688|nr:DUF3885 domain-containing protein [Sutcliffiella halmapala]
MELKEYLAINFPGLMLKPSLYHQWEAGIHFVLGEGMDAFKSGIDELNLGRFNRVHNQALAIFNEVFSFEDEIFLVTNVYQPKAYRNRRQRTRVYDHYIKNKELKFHLKQETLPYMFDDEERHECYTSRFFLKCRKQDINYPLLIQATCNEDCHLKPKLGRVNGSYYPDVFFINVTKNIIFFIYDDRGCEVIASDKDTIRTLCEKYHDWVDGNYREEINRRFKLNYQ